MKPYKYSARKPLGTQLVVRSLTGMGCVTPPSPHAHCQKMGVMNFVMQLMANHLTLERNFARSGGECLIIQGETGDVLRSIEQNLAGCAKHCDRSVAVAGQ